MNTFNKNTMSNITKLSNEMDELYPLTTSDRHSIEGMFHILDIENALSEELRKENEYSDWCKQFRRDLYNDVFNSRWSRLAEKKRVMIEQMSNGCKYSGCREFEDSGIGYWVFDGSMTDSDIRKALDSMGIYPYNDRGVFDEMDWDCSGQCMLDEPWIEKRTKTRVLVTQTWCYDV
tara:strand:- start:37397 stop:37924 length:528 start_codon:yes stop_codon:yes gene_type:complete